MKAAGLKVGDYVILIEPDWPPYLQGWHLGRIASIGVRSDHPLFAQIMVEPPQNLLLLNEVMIVNKTPGTEDELEFLRQAFGFEISNLRFQIPATQARRGLSTKGTREREAGLFFFGFRVFPVFGFRVLYGFRVYFMRWPVYFIFAYVMLGLQVGMSRFIAFHGAAPNLGLIAVLFIAFNTRRETALLACFVIGFLQDLLSEQQPGLFAFAYGLVAMVVVETHQSVNRGRLIKPFVFALIGGLITALVILLHSWLHPAGEMANDGKVILPPVRISAGVEFTRAVYTAVLAPIVLARWTEFAAYSRLRR